MNVNLSIWDKLTQVVLFLLLAAVIMGIVVWYLPLIQQNERMRKEILRLDNQIKQEEENSRQLKAAIDNLRDPGTAPKAVERLAREKLGYAKPGETVIRFQEPAPAPLTNTASQ